MKFFNLERKEYKKYAKEFRKTYIGQKLCRIYQIFLTFIMLNLGISFVFEVVLDKEGSVYGTIILWTMCISMLISYYTYFKYLKEYIEKDEK